MTVSALISGPLFRPPEQKISKAGKPYVSATIRVQAGDRPQFWRAVAFSETAQSNLLRLGEGESVSCQGPMRAEIYCPEGGEPRVSYSIVADAVLALRPAPKSRAKEPPAPTPLEALAARCDDAFDDDLPF